MAWLEVNDVSLRYTVEGGAGPAVVLLHELGGSLDSWDDVAPGLAAAGYRVLRYDQRGAGLSEKPRTPVTAGLLAADLGAMLEATGLARPVHVVAVAAATVQALLFADTPGTVVASQALCNPAALITAARAAQLEERSVLTEREGMRAALPVTLDRSWPPGMFDPAAYQRYRARYLANDPACFAAHNRVLAASDVLSLVPRIRCPVMVVAGRHDQVRPAAGSAEFAARIPGARFEQVDSGHMMAAQAPAELTALLLSFLGGLSTAAVPTGRAGGRR
jgi:3-oxoadipate enol-lactonase